MTFLCKGMHDEFSDPITQGLYSPVQYLASICIKIRNIKIKFISFSSSLPSALFVMNLCFTFFLNAIFLNSSAIPKITKTLKFNEM